MTKDSEAPRMRWTFPSFDLRAVPGEKPHLLKSAYAVSKRQDVIKLHPWECRIAQGVSLIRQR